MDNTDETLLLAFLTQRTLCNSPAETSLPNFFDLSASLSTQFLTSLSKISESCSLVRINKFLPKKYLFLLEIRDFPSGSFKLAYQNYVQIKFEQMILFLEIMLRSFPGILSFPDKCNPGVHRGSGQDNVGYNAGWKIGRNVISKPEPLCLLH